MKDAASSAIYGSRAAYGVVLVTTKGGKAEKMNVAGSNIHEVFPPNGKQVRAFALEQPVAETDEWVMIGPVAYTHLNI